MDSQITRLLVVEDNVALARVIVFNLQRAGYQVLSAANGKEAWEAVQKTRMDLIVTDQQMPEMEGTEFCYRLRSLEQYYETPIILLTAKALELDHKKLADELRVSAILMKPFSPAELVQYVERCLDSVA